jgi:DNA-binding transcriptional LysR family regulator
MSLNAYEIFMTVVEQGSFVKASELLNITPSAISHSMTVLEETFGYPLLNRSRQGITLTNYGKSLIPSIGNVLKADARLLQRVSMLNGMAIGTVSIGCFNSICNTHLPIIVEEFKKEYPQIEIKIYQGTYTDVIAWVKNGIVDIGFLSEESARGELAFEPLFEDELYCTAPTMKTFASKDYITHEEMLLETFVSQSESTDSDIQNYLNTYRLKLKVNSYVTDDQAAVNLVSHGYGISIMPKLVIDSIQANIKKYSLKPKGFRQIGLSCDVRRLSPAGEKMYHTIKAYYLKQDKTKGS